MKFVDVLVAGGGPAGLSAAIAAAEAGCSVLVCEREDHLGGQLAKQTHKFFGDARQCAGKRGFEIARELEDRLLCLNRAEVWVNAAIQGWFKQDVITCEHEGYYVEIRAKKIILGTGASEKFLPFEGNDLPGVYGAGAVQTLMNLYGVRPAKKVVMVGSGNIGLIVSYQLRQAGVEVLAVVEASEAVGGFEVHAAKLRRMGIPILTGYSVRRAYGRGSVEGVVVAAVDGKRGFIPRTERDYACGCVCLAVGLQPLAELCWQGGCKMKYIAELGGYVPLTTEYMETSRKGVFAAGDLSGIEEASSALIEGRIAGISAALELKGTDKALSDDRKQALKELGAMREGPAGAKVRQGIWRMREAG